MSRITEAKEIIDTLVTASLRLYTDILIHNDKLIFTVCDTLLEEVILEDISDGLDNIMGFRYSDLICEGDNITFINDNIVISKILSYYSLYSNISANNPLIASDLELRGNEEFEKLLALKADDGMRYYNMIGIDQAKTYLIPMFSGFINLSKPDKIGINLYDMDTTNILMEYIISKKKIKRDIKSYCRILKI